ncbi:CHAT domain-containing protein [Flammeovirga agarivorans]|uniref:CHAT domain-containing protein n=1 Tax=Flammeovirga agarivorans TaxID=2726742 RepID=A0A7X8SID2_9BACT|nr:CHAT domain-containing tetratricopeptide repeat protein [Flammeovirga agarivorans]NLR90780.1 CHAT domain-containing protein [Flammeovirga agarivorans]
MTHTLRTIFLLLIVLLIPKSLKAEDFGNPFTMEAIQTLINKGELDLAKKNSWEWVEAMQAQHGEMSIHENIARFSLGRVCLERQEYGEALNHFQYSADILEETTGWLYPDYAISLNYLATCYIRLGQVEYPKKLLKEIKIIIDKTIGQNSINYAHYLMNWGMIYSYEGSFEKAEQYMLDAKRIAINMKYRRSFDKDFEEVDIHLSHLYSISFRHDQAIDLMQKTLSELDAKKRENSPNYSRCLLVLGDAYRLAGFYDKALESYKDAEFHVKKMVGTNHFAYAAVEERIGNLYAEISQFDKATPLLESASEIYKMDETEVVRYTSCLVILANVALKRGEYKLAEDYLNTIQQAVGEEEVKQNDAFQITTARLLIIKGEFVESELIFSQTLARMLDKNMTHTRFFLETNLDYVELLAYTGRTDKAENIINKGIKLLKRIDQDSTLNFAETLYCKGFTDRRKGATKEAISNLKSSNELIDFLNLDTSILKAYNSEELANIYSEQGKLDSANYYFGIAFSIFKEKVTAYDVHFIYTQISYANLLIKEQKYQDALDIFIELDEKVTTGTILDTMVNGGIAYTNALLGNWDKAEEMIISAIQARLKFYDNTMKYSSSQDKIKYLHQTGSLFDVFYDIMYMMGDNVTPLMLKNCYDIHLKFRSFFLVETRERNKHLYKYKDDRVAQGFPAYLSKMLSLRDGIAALNYMSVQQRKELGVDPYLLLDNINNLEKSLVLASNAYVNQQSDLIYKGWKDIKNVLKEGEVVIEIVKLRTSLGNTSRYIALVVDKNAEYPMYVPIGKSEQLENEAFSIYQRKSTPLGRNMVMVEAEEESSPYKIYWKPISNFLKTRKEKYNTIYFIADGIYNLINVNTLQNEMTEQYLIQEEYIKQLNGSTELLSSTRNQEMPRKKNAVLIGNPVFEENNLSENGTRATKSKGLKIQLDELPGTGEEIEISEKLLMKNNWKVEVFTREAATEELIKTLKTSPTVLHIATHGFFLNKMRYSVSNNPMLRSGLFFSEFIQTDTKSLNEIYNSGLDGILTAYEVAGLNLSNTELLILSACQSGVSEVTEGEGISGLQYAFSIAGVHSVVMSLWSVDDRATKELMTKFYEHWNVMGDRHKAFYQAQLDIMARYKRPYFWGAFVMIN